MDGKQRIGIIICDRYKTCAGGKCFRALRNKEGAFSIYKDEDVELAGYTSCGGCPGGNIEYAGMVRVVVGTHPIPATYKAIHDRLETWKAPEWKPRLAPTLSDETTRVAYD